jgi:hypothetical protein
MGVSSFLISQILRHSLEATPSWSDHLRSEAGSCPSGNSNNCMTQKTCQMWTRTFLLQAAQKPFWFLYVSFGLEKLGYPGWGKSHKEETEAGRSGALWATCSSTSARAVTQPGVRTHGCISCLACCSSNTTVFSLSQVPCFSLRIVWKRAKPCLKPSSPTPGF